MKNQVSISVVCLFWWLSPWAYCLISSRSPFLLVYEFIVISDASFFLWRIWVSKEYLGFQSFCNQQMFGELAAVVSCDGSYFADIWQQHEDDRPGQRLCVLPLRQFLRASVKFVFLSTNVTIAPFPSLPMIVSISKLPGVAPFQSAGLSSIMVRFCTTTYGADTCRCRCLSWCRQFFHSSLPFSLSALMYE